MQEKRPKHGFILLADDATLTAPVEVAGRSSLIGFAERAAINRKGWMNEIDRVPFPLLR